MNQVWSKLGLRRDLIALFIKSQILWDGREPRFFSFRFCDAHALLSQAECWDKEKLKKVLVSCSPDGEEKPEVPSQEHISYMDDVREFLRTIA